MDATILYVEDNADNRLLVRRILNADGFDVVEAANAAQAWKVLEAQPPDLILMDINMPDVDGYTLTAQIKSQPHLQAIPIIAMTANALKGDRERSLQAGCDGYIEKPIDIDELTRQILSFLSKRRRTG
jgi:two-component system cell cycle response regulator DivK